MLARLIDYSHDMDRIHLHKNGQEGGEENEEKKDDSRESIVLKEIIPYRKTTSKEG